MSALEDAQITAQQHLRQIAAQVVAAVWNSLPGHDTGNIDQWMTQLLPLLGGINQQSVAITQAYIAQTLGVAPHGVDVAAVLAGIRNGSTPAEVYRRPFVTTWAALNAGQPPEAARTAGLERAMSAAETDVQLAQTHTAAAIGRADHAISGWERVPDPGACALCRIASTQRYHRGDLQPIHNRCGCGVRPLLGEQAGRVINPERLAELRASGDLDRITAQRQAAAARAATGIDVAVREHGELGPLLTNKADEFTSENDF